MLRNLAILVACTCCVVTLGAFLTNYMNLNPFLYSALIILCFCGFSTISIPKDSNIMGAAMITSVWTIAACSLVSIGLASRTKTGVGAALATVLLVTCAVSMMWIRIK